MSDMYCTYLDVDDAVERVKVLDEDVLHQLGVDGDEGGLDPVVAAVGLSKLFVLLCVHVLINLKMGRSQLN